MSRCVLPGASVAAVLTLFACANGGEAEADLEPIVPSDRDAGDGARSSSPDGRARPRSDGGGVPDPGPQDDGGDDTVCTGKVVVNELLPEGAGGAEFIELYNPNGCAVSLAGWKLRYQSKTGGSGPDFFTFAAQDKIAPRAFLVLGNNAFTGAKDKSVAGNANIGNAGGQVGLVDDTGELVDGIGYGATEGAYIENKSAPLPPAGSSVGRKSDGVDTDDNSVDCKAFSQPSPGAPN